jgi:hypothetical protein
MRLRGGCRDLSGNRRDALRHPSYRCSNGQQLARKNAGPVLQVNLTFEMAIEPESASRERPRNAVDPGGLK